MSLAVTVSEALEPSGGEKKREEFVRERRKKKGVEEYRAYRRPAEIPS